MAHYNDFDDEDRARGPVAIMIVVVSVIILLILVLVFAANNTTTGKNNLKRTQMLEGVTSSPEIVTAVDIASNYTDSDGNKDIEKLYRDNKLRSEDLDFWDMYSGGTIISDGAPDEIEQEEIPDISTDGDDDSIENQDVEEEKQDLIEGIPLNNIDFTNLQIVNNKMHYFLNDEEVSKLGVEISENSGQVDFDVLKKEGIDFVMIKAGGRDYESGVLKTDERFEDNISAASEAGLDIGLIFSSRAVNKEEAVEEADFVIGLVSGYDIDYPIAYCFEGKAFDEARTDILTPDKQTQIAEAFLREVQLKNYKSILYGTIDYLSEDIEPEKLLKNNDIMLNYIGNLPDYPYKYKMWKYISNMSINGIQNPGAYVISFVDYSGR